MRLRFAQPRAGRERSGSSHRALQFDQHRVRVAEGPGPGEQFVGHHAQREHVARHLRPLTPQLLRAGVARRTHARPRGGRAGMSRGQRGRAKIEQSHGAFDRHQNVRGLQIPVHRQVAMREVHHLADVQHQAQPRFHAQLAPVAIAVDRLALDQLCNQIGIAVRGDASVQKPRNPRMIEPGQQLLLAMEVAQKIGSGQSLGQDLDRHGAFELPVGAPPAIDRAGAAAA